MAVVKTSIALPLIYKVKLKQGAKRLGISQSEFMRRAIDDYLAKMGIPVVLPEYTEIIEKIKEES